MRCRVDGAEKDYIKIAYAGATGSMSRRRSSTWCASTSAPRGEDEGEPVKLYKLGGTDWAKQKTRAKAAAKSMAKGLTELYAERQRTPRLRLFAGLPLAARV